MLYHETEEYKREREAKDWVRADVVVQGLMNPRRSHLELDSIGHDRMIQVPTRERYFGSIGEFDESEE
jgi:hypothetical protein